MHNTCYLEYFHRRTVNADFGFFAGASVDPGSAPQLIFVRNASKKAGGSSSNGRDSNPKNLGLKKYGGQVCKSIHLLRTRRFTFATSSMPLLVEAVADDLVGSAYGTFQLVLKSLQQIVLQPPKAGGVLRDLRFPSFFVKILQ